jgi:3-methyladenine DNA glycosylase AlkD
VKLAGSIAQLRAALEPFADASKVESMQAYMRDQFVYMGLTSPNRRKANKPWITAGKSADSDDLLRFAEECWAEDEREFQYCAAEVLRAGAKVLSPPDLPRVRALVETKSWWDTIDSLAPWTIGPMVTNHPELTAVMDQWIKDDNIWVARSAILHQLGYKDRTDGERLFRYADLRAEDTEFFIRKALGWALRQYARVDPEAVRAYVQMNEDKLSGLTKREALKHL